MPPSAAFDGEPNVRDHTTTEQTHVEYHFECNGDSGGWQVRRFDLDERMSAPYRLVLELDNTDPTADATELVGQNASLFIERQPRARQVQGLVVRVERGISLDPRYTVCTVHMAPAFLMLQQIVDARIFQEMSVPEILGEVVGSDLASYGRELDATALQGKYETREYTVQYQESDFDFASRLMEQEGIGYRFEHRNSTEVMVLSDTNLTFEELETTDGGPVSFMADNIGLFTTEPVRSFWVGNELAPTSVDLRDYDWTAPGLELKKVVEGEDPAGRSREVHVYQRGMTVTGYTEPSYEVHDVERQATLRHQELRVGVVEARGESWITGLAPGRTFELTRHHDPSLDGSYAVTSVDHRGARASGDESGSHGYVNRFTCIPAETAYRPRRRTPRPRVHGVQTALVVGPSGEEIHTDAHGRIKVQFHWDRLGSRDEHSSCWVRVSQTWGGAGWGFSFIPRMGMEVVVTFIDGDPDRPLVTGCVYNGDNAPPYALPENKTKSTIKTKSSPGSEGFNELRFEDRVGDEEIYLHAQKDFNEKVLNCHNTIVAAAQTNTVGGAQSEHIGMGQSLIVAGARVKVVHLNEETKIDHNRIETVKMDETITIEGNRTETVKKDETITVEGNRTETVKMDELISIEGNRRQVVYRDETITVEGAKREKVKSTYDVTATGAYTLTDDEEISFRTGDSSIVLKSDGTIAIKGKVVELVGGKSSITMDDSEAATEAARVMLRGKDEVLAESKKVKMN